MSVEVASRARPERPPGGLAGLWGRASEAIARNTTLYAYLTLAPTLLLILVFIAYPLVYAVYISVLDYTPDRPENAFVGLDNYLNVVTNEYFLWSLWNTFYFVAVALVLVIVVSLAMALVLSESFRGREFLLAAILLPYALPPSVNAAIFRWIYDSNTGVLNGVLFKFGIIEQYITWLGDTNLAMPAVILAYVWKFVPYSVFLFLAGLTSIPKSLYEAAQIDCASTLTIFRKITLPMLRPVFQLVLIIQTIFAMLYHFALVYLLTAGGPGGATTTIAWYAYQETFSYMHFGRGAAVGVILAVMIAGLIYYYLVVMNPEKNRGAV